MLADASLHMHFDQLACADPAACHQGTVLACAVMAAAFCLKLSPKWGPMVPNSGPAWSSLSGMQAHNLFLCDSGKTTPFLRTAAGDLEAPTTRQPTQAAVMQPSRHHGTAQGTMSQTVSLAGRGSALGSLQGQAASAGLRMAHAAPGKLPARPRHQQQTSRPLGSHDSQAPAAPQSCQAAPEELMQPGSTVPGREAGAEPGTASHGAVQELTAGQATASGVTAGEDVAARSQTGAVQPAPPSTAAQASASTLSAGSSGKAPAGKENLRTAAQPADAVLDAKASCGLDVSLMSENWQ